MLPGLLEWLLVNNMTLAEVRLVVATKEARLVVRHGDDVVEDELWKFPAQMSRTEAKELAKTVFDSTYDMLNFLNNGGPE